MQELPLDTENNNRLWFLCKSENEFWAHSETFREPKQMFLYEKGLSSLWLLSSFGHILLIDMIWILAFAQPSLI